MNKRLVGILTFATGAALGSVVSVFLVKTKYERYAQEEVEEVRKYYNNKYETDKKMLEPIYMVDEPGICEPNKTINIQEQLKLKEEVIAASNGTWAKVDEKIYLITPEELGEFDDYDVVGLSYYEEDNILADNDGNKVELEVIGGPEMLDNFGEYEEDVLQVRNEKHRTDYEVYLIHSSYLDDRARD